jgi:hypothetical protein
VGHDFLAQFRVRTLHRNNQVNPGHQRASKRFKLFWSHLKGLYGGLHFLSRSYYYLRRQSPGPPFPPDHRQAGERGANMSRKVFKYEVVKEKGSFTRYTLI